jgi:hypothetical protein
LCDITENINLKKGLINHTREKIYAINLRANNEVDFINILLIDFGLQIKLKRSIIPYKYLFHGKFFKATFPLVLAYAMISHKSQRAIISSK